MGLLCHLEYCSEPPLSKGQTYPVCQPTNNLVPLFPCPFYSPIPRNGNTTAELRGSQRLTKKVNGVTKTKELGVFVLEKRSHGGKEHPFHVLSEGPSWRRE